MTLKQVKRDASGAGPGARKEGMLGSHSGLINNWKRPQEKSREGRGVEEKKEEGGKRGDDDSEF